MQAVRQILLDGAVQDLSAGPVLPAQSAARRVLHVTVAEVHCGAVGRDIAFSAAVADPEVLERAAAGAAEDEPVPVAGLGPGRTTVAVGISAVDIVVD